MMVSPRGRENVRNKRYNVGSGDARQLGTWGLTSDRESVTMRAYKGGREAETLNG